MKSPVATEWVKTCTPNWWSSRRPDGTNQYQYEIHDWSNGLHEDLQQDASNHDFRGYYEYYDIFLSDADGTFNPNGSFVTVQARSDLSTTNLGVGHNIDAIGIRDANGNVLYASEVLAVVLGDGLGVDNRLTVTKRPSSVLRTRFLPGSATTSGVDHRRLLPHLGGRLRRALTGLRCHGCAGCPRRGDVRWPPRPAGRARR